MDDFTERDAALLTLSEKLLRQGYRFVTPTPDDPPPRAGARAGADRRDR